MKNAPTRSIDEIANEIFARHGGCIELLRKDHTRKQETVWLISLICAKAFSEGWGYSAIGRYVDRTHDTVMGHVKAQQ